jgi:hydroxyacylglutathione hydrolase
MAPAYHVFHRPYPSANCVLLTGPRPILVDSGYVASADELAPWLLTHGVPPEGLALLVNTHHHGDHVGGNHCLQQRYGTQVAAHGWEAGPVNDRDAEACAAAFLQQPVLPYRVDRLLEAGETLDTGTTRWQVLHTPGHTLGHLSVYAPALGVLVVGDAFHAGGEVGWLNPFREGIGSLARSAQTLQQLAGLPLRRAISGHGPVMTDPGADLAAAQRRLATWHSAPDKVLTHAAKRILVYALMLNSGLRPRELDAYWAQAPWVQDFARAAGAASPGAYGAQLVASMLGAGTVRWHEQRLQCSMAYQVVAPPAWAIAPLLPAQWSLVT